MPATTHWTPDVENILKKIRLHSLMRSKYHQTSYFNMNRLLKYFRIPVIVLSAVSSVFSVVLPQYMSIDTSSMICCFISLTVGLIGSIEMFLQIQKRMEIDLHNAKSFGILATDITKMLNLSYANRTVDGLTFLEEKMNEYNSLVDLSIVIDIQLHEKILELNLIDNLTEEEELSILTNDNLQSIFRRYKLLFLTKRRLELRDGKPESDANNNSNKSPRQVISNFIKKVSSSNLNTVQTNGTVGGMTDAEMDRDIDSITRNRSSSKASILSSFVSAIRGVSRTATPNISTHPCVPPLLQMPIPRYPPPISTPIAKTPNTMQTPISRTPTQRRSGSRPGQSMVNSQSLQNTNDFATQLRTKLETLHEAKNETELSTPIPGLPLYDDDNIQLQIDIESGLNPKSDSRSSQSSLSKDDIEYTSSKI